MKAAMEGLLTRSSDIGISNVTHQVIVHPNRDPGCRLHGHELLRTLQRGYRFALLMFDFEGSGAVRGNRAEVESEAEVNLAVSGWKDRSAVVVIDPELEIWVWTDSPWVERILGWEGRNPAMRPWLVQQGFVFGETGKPNNPKTALEAALRLARKPRSSALYRDLAEKVSFDQCLDPAFLKLKGCLQKWFGG